jgi:hypothetical protein
MTLRAFAWKVLGTLLIVLGIGAVVATIQSLRTSIVASAIDSLIAFVLLAGGGVLRSWSEELRWQRRMKIATEAGRAARRMEAAEAAGVLTLAYSHGHERSVIDHSVLSEHLADVHGIYALSLTTRELHDTHEKEHLTSPHRWLADLTSDHAR